MDKVSINGQMVDSTSVIIIMTRRTDSEYMSMQMVELILEAGPRVFRTISEFMLSPMEISERVIGKARIGRSG